MGLSEIDKIAKSIVECGRDSMTPAVAVSNATRGNQRRVFGTLDDIGRRVPKKRSVTGSLPDRRSGERIPVRVPVADVLREALNAAPV